VNITCAWLVSYSNICFQSSIFVCIERNALLNYLSSGVIIDFSSGPTWSEINFAQRFHCRSSIAVYKGGLELREEDQPDAHFS